jgi:hypothetical protein
VRPAGAAPRPAARSTTRRRTGPASFGSRRRRARRAGPVRARTCRWSPAISTNEADRRTAADRSYRRDDAQPSQGAHRRSRAARKARQTSRGQLVARRSRRGRGRPRSTTTRTSSPESSFSVARSRITTQCRTAHAHAMPRSRADGDARAPPRVRVGRRSSSVPFFAGSRVW